MMFFSHCMHFMFFGVVAWEIWGWLGQLMMNMSTLFSFLVFFEPASHSLFGWNYPSTFECIIHAKVGYA